MKKRGFLTTFENRILNLDDDNYYIVFNILTEHRNSGSIDNDTLSLLCEVLEEEKLYIDNTGLSTNMVSSLVRLELLEFFRLIENNTFPIRHTLKDYTANL